MAYTLDQLSTMIDALTARVNAIDGINLPSSVASALATLQAANTSTNQDLKQSLLVIQQQLLTQTALLNQYIALVNTKLGV
jgi:hypothetical protein